ncbi:MAG: mannose-1-phosphate guanylyltransferase [Gemmatimonadetes bacterium]|nr:mannose-1-phosphate guanylyltransferase [Gemmatimonadota bacterium]
MVLAGGVGSRFWPVSTPSRPKQLLPLASERPLIVDTVARILPLVPVPRVRILTGAALAEPILAALPELGRDNLLVEPQARGTAPVLAWAALEIARREPGAVMISLHADHAIAPADVFRALLGRVGRLAQTHARLFTLGVTPSRPETGYGYLRVGAPLDDGDAFEVAEFVEKPDADTAREYLRREGYLWNSGIFVWRVGVLLEELRRHTPEIGERLGLLERGRVADFFEQVPVLSIDEGLLERSPSVAVARANFSWDDVGAWDAVGRTRVGDAAGNVAVGDAHLVDATGCVAWAEDGAIVVFGGRDLVVVRAGGLTFVAPRERSAELKELLKQLPDRLARPEQ